jgi:anion-transporting  ArsA/GET3 family ATPase
MCLNTHTDNSPIAPWNQEENEPLSELEQLQEDYGEMRSKLEKAKKQLQYCISIAEQSTNTLLLRNLEKIKL